MTVCKELKYIFVHVPKTGGTPIYKRLMAHYKGKHRMVHADAETTKINVGESFWNRSFKFSFVRNPYSRLVSWYFWILQEAKIKKEIIHPESFENFVKNYIQLYSDQPVEKMAYSFRQTQTSFLSTKNKELDVNYIGKFERLRNDWKFICQQLNLEFKELQVYKMQNYGSWTQHYNPELIDIVNERFNEDFINFGYQKYE